MKSHFYLDAEELERDWGLIEPILASVVSRAVHGEFNCGDLMAMAKSKRIVIGAFFADDGDMLLAFAFEFRFYPKKTAINILALGGKRMDAVFSEFLDPFKDWAASAGADFLEASCSRAMSRMLAKYGYVNTYQQLRLDLKQEEGNG
mgnify:CR=1 FL=1